MKEVKGAAEVLYTKAMWSKLLHLQGILPHNHPLCLCVSIHITYLLHGSKQGGGSAIHSLAYIHSLHVMLIKP